MTRGVGHKLPPETRDPGLILTTTTPPSPYPQGLKPEEGSTSNSPHSAWSDYAWQYLGAFGPAGDVGPGGLLTSSPVFSKLCLSLNILESEAACTGIRRQTVGSLNLSWDSNLWWRNFGTRISLQTGLHGLCHCRHSRQRAVRVSSHILTFDL